MTEFAFPIPDEFVAELADRVLELVIERLEERDARGDGRQWFDVAGAADYLAMPAERLRKLVGRRGIPFHQEGPGCRLFFSRVDLDTWMAAARHVPRGTA